MTGCECFSSTLPISNCSSLKVTPGMFIKVEEESEAQATAVLEVQVDGNLLRRGLLSEQAASGAQQRGKDESHEDEGHAASPAPP